MVLKSYRDLINDLKDYALDLGYGDSLVGLGIKEIFRLAKLIAEAGIKMYIFWCRKAARVLPHTMAERAAVAHEDLASQSFVKGWPSRVARTPSWDLRAILRIKDQTYNLSANWVRLPYRPDKDWE